MGNFLRKFCLVMSVLAVVLQLNVVEAAPKKIGLLSVSNLSGYGGVDFAKIIEGEISTRLVNNSNYQLVERSYLYNIMRELGRDMNTGYSDDISTQVASTAGLDYILTAEVTQATISQQQIPFIGNQIKAKVGIRLIVLDKNSGQRVMDDTVTDTASLAFGQTATSDHLIAEAMKSATKKVMEEFEERRPIVGTVVAIVDGQCYTDLGRNDNVKTGDKVTIYREGNPIFGTDGTILTVPKKVIAVVKLKSVDEQSSVCDATDGVKKGDKVRRGEMKK